MRLPNNQKMLSASTMYDRFLEHVKTRRLFEPHQRILLAVSGGLDSMTMLELFKQSPFSFGIAHCNFQLRGSEAHKDQLFVEDTARKWRLPFYTISFDTLAYAKKHKLSIQMAARDLRYEWFEKVRQKEGFDLVATAHHLDDSIETLLLNLCRGTGIDGLTGIPAISGHVIRPLLYTSRKEIESYVTDHTIEYREDASNNEDKYHRNAIRHQIIPVMETINPSFQPTMEAFFTKMQAKAAIYHQAIRQARKVSCIRTDDHGLRIIIPKLLAFNNYEVFLYEFLKEFGFTPPVCHDIANDLSRQPGKVFYSPSHTLVADRNELLVFPISQQKTDDILSVPESTNQVHFNHYKLLFETIDLKNEKLPPFSNEHNTAWLDYDKLTFPLTIRTWKYGDKIIPLGMSGSKKLSDLFIENKIPVHKKQQIPVILSVGTITWVAGLRSSDKYKISKTTKKILRIKCLPNPSNT